MILPPVARGGSVVVITSRILVVWMVIFSITGLLVGIESFLPTLPLPSLSKKTARATNYFHHCDLPVNHYRGGCKAHKIRTQVRKQQQQQLRQSKSSSLVILNGREEDTNDINSGGGTTSGLVESIGLVSQPIVWISLYSLATTGHGLPAGPGGSIGAVEGIAYLVVVALALLPTSLWTTNSPEAETSNDSLARTLSRTSIALGLVVLAGVVAGKGCVPNAKPILDYSAYLPVCGPEQLQ